MLIEWHLKIDRRNRSTAFHRVSHLMRVNVWVVYAWVFVFTLEKFQAKLNRSREIFTLLRLCWRLAKFCRKHNQWFGKSFLFEKISSTWTLQSARRARINSNFSFQEINKKVHEVHRVSSADLDCFVEFLSVWFEKCRTILLIFVVSSLNEINICGRWRHESVDRENWV